MFSGFVKSIPVEIEEAADVDGAGPLRTFFGIVLPIMKPTFISVAILETMWIWNDYLLPYLILDMDYKTIPIHIQYLNGSYGHTDTSAIMALIVLSIVPIIIFYFACQKYIIEGVVSGAVKGYLSFILFSKNGCVPYATQPFFSLVFFLSCRQFV